MLTCPSCGDTIEGRECPECQKNCPEDAKFCCYCGIELNRSTEPPGAESTGGDPYDLENRVLCPDGTCVGIINENGVCTECGRSEKG